MRTSSSIALVAALFVAGLAFPALTAQNAPSQDAGGLDKAKAEKAFPTKPLYSPYS
jgi:hypothetical protein